MKIDIRNYILEQIGHTDWHGETNHDDISYKNLKNVKETLYFIEDLKEEIRSLLMEHTTYRKGNGSAEMLHKKAKEIDKLFELNCGFEER